MAAEDIYDNQGSIVAHRGDVVEKLTVDENGTATSDNLFYLGRYEAKIKSCPIHLEYEADSTYPIVLSYQGQDVPIVSAHAEIPLHNIIQMPETGKDDIVWKWIVIAMVLIGSALGTMHVYAKRPLKKYGRRK